MKYHIGVDAGTGYVHTIKTTPDNMHDIGTASELIREDDEVVYDDFGCTFITKRTEIKEAEHLAAIDYHGAAAPRVCLRYQAGLLIEII